MMRWLTLLGIAAIVIGVSIIVEHSVALVFSLNETFLILIGIFALIQGLRYGHRRRHTERRQVELGEPETRDHVPKPGTEYDSQFARATNWTRPSRTAQRTVRNHLRATAAETLALRESLSKDDAIHRVREGTWTDEAVAAEFLSADPQLPIRVRLGSYIRRESSYEYGLRRTVAAIADLQKQ